MKNSTFAVIELRFIQSMKKEDIEKAYHLFKQRMDVLMQTMDNDLAKAEIDLLIHYTNQFISALGLQELGTPQPIQSKIIETKTDNVLPAMPIETSIPDIMDNDAVVTKVEVKKESKIKVQVTKNNGPSNAEALAAQHGAASLHEKISKTKPDTSLADKLEKKPLSDMKKGIGINEKFIFISELFKGDQITYADAIESLNSCPSLTDAENQLQKLSAQFDWESESTAFTLLHNLVERRYAK